MAGMLYVVSRTGERLVFDPDGQFLTVVRAPEEGHSTIVVKPKSKPIPEPIETKGTLPPKPADIDMSFVSGLPDDLEANYLWPAIGSAAPNIPSIKGKVTIDHLKTWARGIPDGQHQVMFLEPADGD